MLNYRSSLYKSRPANIEEIVEFEDDAGVLYAYVCVYACACVRIVLEERKATLFPYVILIGMPMF